MMPTILGHARLQTRLLLVLYSLSLWELTCSWQPLSNCRPPPSIHPSPPPPPPDSSCGSDCDTHRRSLTTTLGGSLWIATATVIKPRSVLALDPPQAKNDYDSYAANYDALDGGKLAQGLQLETARQAMISQARGHVLEIGVGTGLNLPYYIPDQISSLTLVDISPGMLQQAQNKANTLPNVQAISKVTFLQADATSQLVNLLGTESFDTVLDTFSLCVMGQTGAAHCLEQMAQLTKRQSKGGQLLLLENTKSSNPLLGWYQDVTADAAAQLGGKGCVYNQDVQNMILQTNISGGGGLQIESEQSYAEGLFRAYRVSIPGT